jgi:hypothetical protein
MPADALGTALHVARCFSLNASNQLRPILYQAPIYSGTGQNESLHCFYARVGQGMGGPRISERTPAQLAEEAAN